MLAILIAVSLFGCTDEDNASDNRIINILNYPEDSRGRYIACKAYNEGISFEVVENTESMNEQNIVLNEDEEIRYKSINKKTDIIFDGSSYAQEVNMCLEIRIIWNKRLEQPVRIEDFSEPIIYLPNIENFSLGESAYNIERGLLNLRLSRTTYINYNIPKTDIKVGGNIDSVVKDVSNPKNLTITTKTKTSVMEISEKDLLE